MTNLGAIIIFAKTAKTFASHFSHCHPDHWIILITFIFVDIEILYFILCDQYCNKIL